MNEGYRTGITMKRLDLGSGCHCRGKVERAGVFRGRIQISYI